MLRWFEWFFANHFVQPEQILLNHYDWDAASGKIIVKKVEAGIRKRIVQEIATRDKRM